MNRDQRGMLAERFTAGLDDQGLGLSADLYVCDICGRAIELGQAFEVGVTDDGKVHPYEMNYPAHVACVEANRGPAVPYGPQRRPWR